MKGMHAVDRQFKRLDSEESLSQKRDIVFNLQYLKVLSCSAQTKKPVEITDSTFISLELYPFAYSPFFCHLHVR